mmetsp:Transcript_21649/g.49013  ORF Transcript_21649/g.49013 Transcript_21649/m.49013 type:complete len:207 (-) Transcript_21649:410-1030(-)
MRTTTRPNPGGPKPNPTSRTRAWYTEAPGAVASPSNLTTAPMTTAGSPPAIPGAESPTNQTTRTTRGAESPTSQTAGRPQRRRPGPAAATTTARTMMSPGGVLPSPPVRGLTTLRRGAARRGAASQERKPRATAAVTGVIARTEKPSLERPSPQNPKDPRATVNGRGRAAGTVGASLAQKQNPVQHGRVLRVGQCPIRHGMDKPPT